MRYKSYIIRKKFHTAAQRHGVLVRKTIFIFRVLYEDTKKEYFTTEAQEVHGVLVRSSVKLRAVRRTAVLRG